MNVLDRIEYRQRNVGLRYWGPPLWLEVTMTGPDADSWPANADHTQSWDWQSSTPCAEVEELLARGADDDSLVEVVGRYTIENLILNAVHEIGEWFRFDGSRLFPAHTSGSARAGEHDAQGNGTVALQVTFAQQARPYEVAPAEPAPDEEVGRSLVLRLARVAAASRFTHLPGTTIAYETTGPVIRTWVAGQAATTWRSTWSTATVEAADADAEELLALAARDVHHALVSDEADRICRAFHIDGRRRWRLAGPRAPLGADPPDTDTASAQLLSVSIRYGISTAVIHPSTRDQHDDPGWGPFAPASSAERRRS